MNIVDKIGIIRRLSGLTQENLARELGVSFATVNSWINGRSTPHKRRLETIDLLLTKYSGLDLPRPAEHNTLGKKDLILRKSKSHQDTLKLIMKRSDLYDSLLLSLTFNTNRIEGSTLTEDETAAVIFRNETISNKSLIEHLEAKNHQAALKYLFDHLDRKQRIDEKLILKLHSILMNNIRDDAGYYRHHGVRILGSNVPTANYLKIPELMKCLIKELRMKQKDVIGHVTMIHSKFEQIHPFSDGNGRIGRLIMTAMLLENNLPPAVIEIKEKGLYLSSLRKSQLQQDFTDLDDFVCNAILNGYRIIDN